MLITVSGVAGSGKTTAAKHIVALLHARGVVARLHRFQSLPCFTLLSSGKSGRANPGAANESGPAALRWAGYRRRPLTPARSLVYLMRIVAFRLYRLTWGRHECQVMNRYFYDWFSHYELTSDRERRLFRLLSRLIPRPDIAILVTAPVPVLASRRPAYSSEYLATVSQGYDRAQTLWPHLVTIETADTDRATPAIAKVVRQRLDG